MSRTIAAPGWPVATRPKLASPQSIDFIGRPPQGITLTTVTASATPHTVGAWTEVVAANAASTQLIAFNITNVSASATDTSALFDVGIGPAGSEVAVIQSIPIGYAAGLTFLFPLQVNKGERVALRLQALISSDTMYVGTVLLPAPNGARSPRRLITMGANTAASRGTNMPSNDTYVEITSATTEPFAGLITCCAWSGSTAILTETATITTAIGTSGAEVSLGSSTWYQTTAEAAYTHVATTNYESYQPFGGGLACHIPRGTRLACKQSVGRSFRDAILIGVPYA